MTPAEMYVYRINFDKRESVLAEQNRGLFLQAANDAAAIIRLIIEKYSPRRIYQWGSLLNPGAFRDYSDIDIAVEGLPTPTAILSILRDAGNLTRFSLDLVELEKIDPLHAESIRRKGRLVYEQA
ncbi:MAG: hypothetical protein A2487_16675 [Candidatus Raymondbacteria bacterium RifOxyC12_full_50_8]|nr:MAG: hypothetical protein A2350_13770 [Candidatus Raymondbacteria bacterium RifOxyB12_full_50_8]OGJ94419.1 MAG: hypothetical protein A2487_16675 [Candidatus Raymondbacteria bacterium RifOxyC12_full_50_8]